jgi:hypothetical protein
MCNLNCTIASMLASRHARGAIGVRRSISYSGGLGTGSGCGRDGVPDAAEPGRGLRMNIRAWTASTSRSWVSTIAVIILRASRVNDHGETVRLGDTLTHSCETRDVDLAAVTDWCRGAYGTSGSRNVLPSRPR